MSKVVALTGGATGIGAATVARLLAADCQVFVLDVAEPVLPHTTFIHCDLGRPDAIDAATAKLPQRIDSLVNVAGIAGSVGAADAIAINFLGLRHLTESLVGRIAAGGSVVNVASTAGWDWQKRADVVKGLLDTADFAAGIELARRAPPRMDRQPLQIFQTVRRGLYPSRLRFRVAVQRARQLRKSGRRPKHS